MTAAPGLSLLLHSLSPKGVPQLRELYQISYPWGQWGDCLTLGFSVRKSLWFYTQLKSPTPFNQRLGGYPEAPSASLFNFSSVPEQCDSEVYYLLNL